MMRDYDYVQQRAYLEVDVLEKKIYGISELVLAPKSFGLSSVRVHARQCSIQQVWVNGKEAQHEHLNFLEEVIAFRIDAEMSNNDV